MAEINAICIVHTLTGTHTFVKESFAAKAGTASRHVQDLKLRYPMYTYMGRPTYVCATCSENFTRKYSATRHNLTIHNGRGEIVRLIEYLVGRSSRRYQASNPFWYRRRIHNFAHVTTSAATDTVEDTFRPRDLQGQYQQQQTLSPSIPPAAIQNVSPYPTDQSFQSQSMNTTDDDETTTLSQETMLKIQELKSDILSTIGILMR
jgi:hypothetical protein